MITLSSVFLHLLLFLLWFTSLSFSPFPLSLYIFFHFLRRLRKVYFVVCAYSLLLLLVAHYWRLSLMLRNDFCRRYENSSLSRSTTPAPISLPSLNRTSDFVWIYDSSFFLSSFFYRAWLVFFYPFFFPFLSPRDVLLSGFSLLPPRLSLLSFSSSLFQVTVHLVEGCVDFCKK